MTSERSMTDLSGKAVLVVGASSGIGLAAAKAAAAIGAEVTLASRTRERVEAAAQAIPGARTLVFDMLEREAVERALLSNGPLDHLVLTAVGDEYAVMGRLETISDEQVERSLDKLRGYVNVTRAAAPRLRAGGSITLLSGAGAVKPPLGTALPAAVNASIVSLGKALALELAPLRVNVLMPGVVDTPLHGERRRNLAAWAESGALPARRFGQPEDIAHAILFLLSNPYVTGHTLVVDGGLLAT